LVIDYLSSLRVNLSSISRCNVKILHQITKSNNFFPLSVIKSFFHKPLFTHKHLTFPFFKTLKLLFCKSMAERRKKIPTHRRGAQPSSSIDLPPRDVSIDGWISDESKRLEFLTLFKEKPLQMPKFINNG